MYLRTLKCREDVCYCLWTFGGSTGSHPLPYLCASVLVCYLIICRQVCVIDVVLKSLHPPKTVIVFIIIFIVQGLLLNVVIRKIFISIFVDVTDMRDPFKCPRYFDVFFLVPLHMKSKAKTTEPTVLHRHTTPAVDQPTSNNSSGIGNKVDHPHVHQ